MRSIAVLATVALAGSVMASPVDHSGVTIYDVNATSALSLEQTPDHSFAGSVAPVYSNMESGSGYVAFPASGGDANGVIGFDDYVSTSASAFELGSIRFTGGVQQVSGVMFFDFFDASGTYVDGFGIRLSQAGNFIWTIDLSTTIDIDGAGYVQASVDAAGDFGVATTGQWFGSDAAPTIGSTTDYSDFGDGINNHMIELTSVPTPGAGALLAVGGLVATRRRRA